MNRTILNLSVIVLCALPLRSALAEYSTNYSSVDVSRWKCLLCEFESYYGMTGQLSVSSVLTTDDSDRFGRHGSFERAGTRSVLDARIGVNRMKGWVVDASARNIGLDSNDITIDIKNPHSLEAKFRFQQYRHLTESEALTPFRRTNGRLTLDSSWQPDLQTNGFTSLATTNSQIELTTTRRLLESTVSFDVIPRINLSLGHRSTSKDGTQATFRDGIFQSTALPKTIDHDSVANQMQISYRDRRLNAAWSRTNSTFENFEPLLQWESPYRFGLLENESANAFSHEYFNDTFDVSLTLPRNTQLRFHDRRGETKTMPQSLKYGHGSLIRDSEPIHLFAERDHRSRRVLLITALTKEIELTSSRLHYEFKDLRPTEALTPALGGLFLTPERTVRPGDFNRQESEIGVNYRPDSGVHLLSRIWRNTIKRKRQEITENETQGLEIKLTHSIDERWETFSTLRSESRAASTFQAITTNNLYTRRFHQANMKRRGVSGGTRFLFNDGSDFVSLAVDLDRRDYPKSELGLTGKEILGLTFGYGLRPSKRVVVDGHVASHRQSAEIDGSQSLDLSMPWTYTSDDVINSVGVKLMVEPDNRFVDNIRVDYTLSDGQSDLETLFDGATRLFPNQNSRHESLDASFNLREFRGVSIEARVYFEKYDARDWSIDSVTQTSLSNVLTMAHDNPSFENSLFSLQLNRSF